MIKLNFLRDTREDEVIYEVRETNDPNAIGGFMNTFNIVIDDANQEKKYAEMRESSDFPVYAVADRRTKCGYRFIQF